jgi:hypothetical protein
VTLVIGRNDDAQLGKLHFCLPVTLLPCRSQRP